MKRVILLGAVVAAAALSDGGSSVIRHASFDDFHGGTLGNSGANLYVSRSGEVQVVNHWDLNKDGYLDVLISNDHDVMETVDAFIYWNTGHGFESLLPELWRDRPLAGVLLKLMDRPGTITRLPTFGGGRSAIADLNKDGFPDIVFCNYIHNYPGIRTAFVYWGSATGYAPGRKTELPTNWAAGVVAVDLNGDGYPELVFANQGVERGSDEISPPTPDDAFVYWGSATGFLPERATKLASGGAQDVTSGDFNKDGFPDLAFADSRPGKDRVLIFAGGKTGPKPEPSATLALPAPNSLRAADVNGDGFQDLVVTLSGKAESIRIDETPGTEETQNSAHVFLGGTNGLNAREPLRLAARHARASWVADFNRDGSPDIAIANGEGASYVYWGAGGHFSAARRTELLTSSASGVAAGDFNKDGYLDLVFSNSRGEGTHDVASTIYWGGPRGFASYVRSDLQSFGAADVNVSDLNGDGRQDVLLVNQYSGAVDGRVNSTIFWGNPHHHYSPALMTKLPTAGAYDTTVADYNQDGFPDIVVANSYVEGSYLYWGGKEGYSPSRRQTLPIGRAIAGSTADLNGDGYLDLVFVGSKGRVVSAGTILWGSADGFSDKRKSILPLKPKTSLSVSIADLNRDGHLDLVFTDGYFDGVQIFWGNSQDFAESRSWSRKVTAGNVKLADLNNDGYLDFIFPGEFEPQTKTRTAKTRIYWGTKEGTPSFDNVLEMEAYQSLECAVADYNRDGYLDFACSNYMSDSTRSVPMFIFWGNKDGKYSDARRTDLPAESSAGVQALDLNRDGYTDIIIHNHIKDGNHTINTYIYWNGPDGFNKDRKTELPTFGPHFSQMVDAGNLYTRKLEEEYVSAPIALPPGKSAASITWKADEAHGARLDFEVRSAPGKEALATAKWSACRRGDGASASIPSPGADHRWLQYRAVFRSPDGGAWPVLRGVEVALK
ncbi:MAG: FG-GAP repeat domain-containing protein [Bryobacteraceae bacterium]